MYTKLQDYLKKSCDLVDRAELKGELRETEDEQESLLLAEFNLRRVIFLIQEQLDAYWDKERRSGDTLLG